MDIHISVSSYELIAFILLYFIELSINNPRVMRSTNEYVHWLFGSIKSIIRNIMYFFGKTENSKIQQVDITVPPPILQMPIDVFAHLVGYLTLKDVLVLRKVSKDIRKTIDTSKPQWHLCIIVHVKAHSVEVRILESYDIRQRPRLFASITYEQYQNDCHIKVGRNEVKVVPNCCFAMMALDDVETIFKRCKSMKGLWITQSILPDIPRSFQGEDIWNNDKNRSAHGLIANLKGIMESGGGPKSIDSLTIDCEQTELISDFIRVVLSKNLKFLDITDSTRGLNGPNVMDISPDAIDKLNSLENLAVRNILVNIPMEKISGIRLVNVMMDRVTLEDLRMIKERKRESSGTYSFEIKFFNRIDPEHMFEMFGEREDNGEELVWMLDVPDSNDILRIKSLERNIHGRLEYTVEFWRREVD